MRDCLYAIRTGWVQSVLLKTGFAAMAAAIMFAPLPAHAILTEEDLTLQEEDNVDADACRQAWPVSCAEGGGGNSGCGGWSIINDLASSVRMPGDSYASCSTGVSLGMGANAQGQAVGAMFPGTVVFSQAGRSRDGRDYGGVVVIQLDLDDGSPQCFARYMFLDRRDMVRTGATVEAGQRIGSVASDDMSSTKRWWSENWGGSFAPQVKIDIGCDEALVNLPHFMPREPHDGGSIENPDTCPLTKMRFPAPPLEYLVNTEHGGNTACHVGIRKDAREGILPAPPKDDSELDMPVTGEYVETVKARGVIKRKETPVFAVFSNAEMRDNLFGANKNRSGGSILFRDHVNYPQATTLRCENMREIFRGRDGDSLTAEEVRELMNHCTNQYILGRAMYSKVYEQSSAISSRLQNPLPYRLRAFMEPEDRVKYEEMLSAGYNGNEIFDEMEKEIVSVYWRDLCQPLKMQPVRFKDYKVNELLRKSWEELLIEWPEGQNLEPVGRNPIPRVDINSYTDYPYERINDPSHPFSPRHIFAETERERYSDYGVQCAATPVDLILGTYGEEEPFKTYGLRDKPFHQCIRCRIELNETKEACFADPYSFTNNGGCTSGFGSSTAGDGQLCDNLDQVMLDHIAQLEARYGLYPQLLHAVATAESSCSNDAVSYVGALGMFQFMPATAAGYGIDPLDPIQAAEGSARYYSNSAQQFNCDLPLMLAAYNCGPGCAAGVQRGSRGLPEETKGYISKITAMLGGTTNGCAPGGPHPSGNGSGGGGGGASAGGGTSGGGTSGGGLAGDVFGSGGSGVGSNSGPVMGSFDAAGCPAGYVGNSYSFDGGATTKCAPFSYPTPDLPGPGTFGCHGRNFYPPGCDAACQDRFNARCNPIRDYYRSGGASRNSVCSSASCPPRIHEGMDIAFEYGAPVYSSADGVVKDINEDGTFLTVDHSGKCIDPGCQRRFPSGIETKYYHMGTQRILVQEGQEVTRCQQIGSVGDARSEGVPHLHWETWDPNSRMGRDITAHWGLAQDERFHAHIDDKSCTGGMWDAEGTTGGRGICKFALPVNTIGKEDLEPPAYFEEYEFPDVQMPNPPSADRGDKFDLDTPGMVYEGAWRACTNVPANLRDVCEELNETEGSEVDSPQGDPVSPSGGVGNFINPLPCFPMTSPFGYRTHPILGTPNLHTGMDIGTSGQTPPIFAVADGVVESAGTMGDYGNFVMIRHADGSVTEYAHQSQICPEMRVGSTVVQGQVVGYVGTTGMSTGEHLHFNVRNPDYIDPQPLIPAQTPGAPQCPQINSYRCGQTIDGQPVGSGVAGGSGIRLCVDKPCTLRYDEADVVSQCAYPSSDGGCGTLGHFSQRDEGDNGDCCFNITAPVTPLNVLKIRPGYDNEAPVAGAVQVDDFMGGAWEGLRPNDGLPNGLNSEGGSVPQSEANPGAPEGYTFHEHFRNHRPYMRWWDTGAESGNILQETTDAESIGGSFDALVGVGIEKNNCGIGGWGRPQELDGDSSWMELKLYQSRSQYMNGLRCISRYEKVFKRGASEDYAHRLAGGNFETSFSGLGSTGTVSLNFPIGWRGYASESEEAYRFPYYLNYPQHDPTANAAMVGGGLDQALPGDIIIWDKDVVGNNRLHQIAYVTKADNLAINELSGGDYALTNKRFFPPPQRGESIPSITVVDYNHGKYPDVCGNTNWWAVGPERILYKGDVPENLKYIADRTDVGSLTCGNPDLASCIENYWDDVKVYRPWKHVRD